VKEAAKEEEVQRLDWSLGSTAFRHRLRRAGARKEPRGKGRPRALPAEGHILSESP